MKRHAVNLGAGATMSAIPNGNKKVVSPLLSLRRRIHVYQAAGKLKPIVFLSWQEGWYQHDNSSQQNPLQEMRRGNRKHLHPRFPLL